MVPIVKPDAANFIFGQSHFIKTVEDLHEALVGAVPGIRFGLAFCEASGTARTAARTLTGKNPSPRKIRKVWPAPMANTLSRARARTNREVHNSSKPWL